MKKIIYSLIWILALQVTVMSCKEDDPELGNPPTEEDAVFSIEVSAENDNILIFKNNSSAFLKKWSFGNGASAEGNEVRGVYPVKGAYEVVLTVYTAGGSVTSKQTVDIAETDPTLLDIPVYNFLTGGKDAADGKTWVVDKNTSGHLGIGPAAGTWPEWYSAPPGDKEGRNLYDDEMTFKLTGFQFSYKSNGTIYVNAAFGTTFPGAVKESDGNDYFAPYSDPTGMTWSLVETSPDKWQLTINGGHLGYYSGNNVYEILSLGENELYVRSLQGGTPGNAWYQRFIPKGFTPPPPPPPAKTTLPVDFEGAKPPFNGFGGSTYDVVDNPDATGINTSAKVGKYIKGFDGNWAGIETTLSAPIDFTTNTAFKYKVYSPVAGKALFKIEVASSNGATFIEVFQNVTKVNEWQELTFDFTGAATNTYDKVALFLDFDNNNGGTFYLDDIKQSAPNCADEENESLDVTTGLNMTMATTGFGQFGNIAAAIVANPFKTGINTSCFVNSYGKTNNCETWSGVGYLLNTAIDFSTATKKKFKLKVYAVNQTTTVTLRLEKMPFPDTEPSAEKTATITATGEWQELEFDFSDINTNTYKNVLIYFDRGSNCDGDLYYFDDLIQVN